MYSILKTVIIKSPLILGTMSSSTLTSSNSNSNSFEIYIIYSYNIFIS